MPPDGTGASPLKSHLHLHCQQIFSFDDHANCRTPAMPYHFGPRLSHRLPHPRLRALQGWQGQRLPWQRRSDFNFAMSDRERVRSSPTHSGPSPKVSTAPLASARRIATRCLATFPSCLGRQCTLSERQWQVQSDPQADHPNHFDTLAPHVGHGPDRLTSSSSRRNLLIARFKPMLYPPPRWLTTNLKTQWKAERSFDSYNSQTKLGISARGQTGPLSLVMNSV